MKELTPNVLSEFSMELSMLLKAGIPAAEALHLLAEDSAPGPRLWLSALSIHLEEESLLSSAAEAAGIFPAYFLNMLRLGERSGRLDEVLSALSVYYQRRAVFSAGLRRALLYPALLILLMAAVFTVLVTRVLPIFQDVFAQVGARMSGVSLSLLRLGGWLSSASAWILGALVLLLVSGLLIYKLPGARGAVTGFFGRKFGGKGLLKRISTSHFAMAMAMAVSSGLDLEQSVSLAGEIAASSPSMRQRVEVCKASLARGESLEKSLLAAGIFSGRDARLLALGAKTGNSDQAMSEIARREEERVLDDLDDALRRVEPALVIIISLVVGLVLFSVMLPLMGIMSTLG